MSSGFNRRLAHNMRPTAPARAGVFRSGGCRDSLKRNSFAFDPEFGAQNALQRRE